MLQQINTENFQQMLSQFSTSELESMIDKFPYFQQAHLLLAKKYQQENNPRFDQQLQLAALYIQDRELLYTLFNKKSDVIPAFEVPIKEVEPVREKPESVELLPLAPEKELQILAAEETESERKEASTQEDITQALIDLEKSMEAIRKVADVATSEVADTVTEQREEHTEIKREEVNLTDNTIDEKPAAEMEGLQKNNSLIVAEEIEKSGEEPAEPAIENFSRIDPHTFDEWLNAFNNKSASAKTEKHIESVEEPALDEELTQLIAENITVDYLHGLVKEETNYAKGLERFIEDQIQRHKQPETRKKIYAKVAEPELITETMAKVYEMQKKYSKAIEAYEALALKFPEKSSLFAARINFLKNIL